MSSMSKRWHSIFNKIVGQECCELVIRALTEQMYTKLIKITFPLLSFSDPQLRVTLSPSIN